MEDFLDIPVLIAIGVIIFVLYRFRSVLGTRTGNERPPVERRDASKPAPKPGDETVVQMRPRPVEPPQKIPSCFPSWRDKANDSRSVMLIISSMIILPIHKIITGSKAATMRQNADTKKSFLLVFQISLKKRGI